MLGVVPHGNLPRLNVKLTEPSFFFAPLRLCASAPLRQLPKEVSRSPRRAERASGSAILAIAARVAMADRPASIRPTASAAVGWAKSGRGTADLSQRRPGVPIFPGSAADGARLRHPKPMTGTARGDCRAGPQRALARRKITVAPIVVTLNLSRRRRGVRKPGLASSEDRIQGQAHPPLQCAFPDHQHAPPVAFERRDGLCIALPVRTQLFFPECAARRRQCEQGASVRVPEATMHKNYRPSAWKNQKTMLREGC